MNAAPLPPPGSAPTATADAAHAVTAPQPLARNITTEAIGTLVVMLAGPGALVLGGDIGRLGAALSFGIGLALALGVLGAVANPAFTLALLIVREIGVRDAVGDWIGQLVGGILGGLAIWGIGDQTRSVVGANGWDRDGFGGLGTVIAAELIFGVVLVAVLLSSIAQGFGRPAIAAFTGGAYAMGNLILLGIDGGGLNPARSIGSALFSDTYPNALDQVWVFVLVPLVAAVVAVFMWLAVDDAEIDDTIFDGTFIDSLQNAATGDDD